MSKENTCAPEKVDGKVKELLATDYNYNPRTLNELCNFASSLNDFTHGLQENRYYSETLAKKVYELTLELNAIELEIEMLRMRSEELQTNVETAILANRKPEIEKNFGNTLNKDVAGVWQQAKAVHKKLQELLAQMTNEYKQKTL